MVLAFDLDDTLYKEKDYVASAHIAIRAYLKDNYSINDGDSKKIMEEADKRGEHPFKAFEPQVSFDEILNVYRYHRPTITLDAHTQRMLEEVVARRFRLALITDGRSLSQRNKIEALGLNRYFSEDAIFISEETGHEKCDVDNFLAVQRLYPNERYCYIGDNPQKDFYHPNLLGWTTIMLRNNGDNIHPQPVIDDIHNAKFSVDDLSLKSLVGIIDAQ